MFHSFKKKQNAPLHESSAVNKTSSGLIQRRYLLLIGLLLLSSYQMAWAQLTVTLGANNLGANNCGSRVLTANVSGGSGNYEYSWASNPASNVNLTPGNTITVSPTVFTTYRVVVYDLTNDIYGRMTVGVYPIVNGSFSTFIPNVFTPNGDGINDRWEVRDANKGTGPIHAYRWHLEIYASGRIFYQSDYTDTNPDLGINGGQIYWDGHGAIDGTYTYYVTLYNCDNTGGQTFSGQVNIFGPVTSVAHPTQPMLEQTAIYPNPVGNQLTVNPAQLLQNDAATNNVTAGQVVTGQKSAKSDIVAGEYQVKLVDKFNQVQRSATSREAQLKFDVSALPEGVYFLQVTQGKETTRRQIVVTH